MGLFSSTVNCRAHVRSTNTILWHIVCQPHDWQHRVFDWDLLSRLYFVSPSDLLLNTHASKSTVTSWPYRHSDGSKEEKVGSYIFCFSQIWFHLWSPLEHWHSWRQSWVSYSTAPAMRRRPRSSGWRVELKKNRSEFFHRPALGWRLARRGWGHHWHRQELLAPRRICRKDPGRQAEFFCLYIPLNDFNWHFLAK